MNSEVERVSTQKGTCLHCNYLDQQIDDIRSKIENMAAHDPHGWRAGAPSKDLFALLTQHKQQLEGFELYKQMCECD